MLSTRMEESTEVGNSATTSLKTCQKSVSTQGATEGNVKSLITERNASSLPVEVASCQSSHPDEVKNRAY